MIAIADQREMGGGALARALHARGITSWLYLGEDTTWRVRAEQQIAGGISRVSIAGLLDGVSHTLRQPYIDLIGSLSLENRSFPWWASELAAKNPYSYLFLRICLLAAARRVLGEERDPPGCIVCSTPALAAGIRNLLRDRDMRHGHLHAPLPDRLAHRATLPGRAQLRSWMDRFPILAVAGTLSPLYREYLDTRLEYRRRILSAQEMEEPPAFPGRDTVLLFTWIDGRNFTPDGKYRDPSLGPLPDLLKMKGYPVAFMGRVLPTFPYRTAVERLKGTGDPVYLPEMFLTPRDVASCRRIADRFDPAIPPDLAIDGIPVAPLLHETVNESRRVHAESLLYRPLVARMAETGLIPARIIHPCEGHSWEAALAWSVREFLPGTGITGYDNLTFSRMVTSMYPAACEFGIRPLPDRIVTNGPLSCRVLRREGWPRERIAPGCGLRHGYLWSSGSSPRRVPPTGNPPGLRILVATAIGLGDSVELVGKAARAFGGVPGHQVTVKCHPLVSGDEVRAALGTLADAENIRFSQESMDLLLPRADLLLYTYTTVCFEALRYGVIPVCVRAENFLNMDKLDGAPGLRQVATDRDDLRRIATGVSAMEPEERARWEMEALEAVRDALAPMTDGCADPFVGGNPGPCGETGAAG